MPTTFAIALFASVTLAWTPDGVLPRTELADTAKEKRTGTGESTVHIENGQLRTMGRAVVAPGCRAVIAGAKDHPVTKVHVAVGDQVSPGQLLIELDDDEPAAETRRARAVVRERRAALARLRAEPVAAAQAVALAEATSIEVELKAAERYFKQLQELRDQAAIPARSLMMQDELVHRLRADESAARARHQLLVLRPIEHEIAALEASLQAAEEELAAQLADLEHYRVHAAIGGTVSWMDVAPGTVTRPGTRAWGEIVDFSSLVVEVLISPGDWERVDPSQPIRFSQSHRPQLQLPATLLHVAPMVDEATSRYLVRLRGANVADRIRCGEQVVVQFTAKD